jgi:hypothetical protein
LAGNGNSRCLALPLGLKQLLAVIHVPVLITHITNQTDPYEDKEEWEYPSQEAGIPFRRESPGKIRARLTQECHN